MSTFSQERLIAFAYKEMLQALRDPSTLLIAIILPGIMIFLFAYGVSLDNDNIRIGLVLEDTSAQARDLAKAFESTPYFQVTSQTNREKLTTALIASKIRGLVVIPQDFSQKLQSKQTSPIQVIADGSETNTASFVQNYAQGVVANWQMNQFSQNGIILPSIITEPRVWFNPELKSRNVILPGSMAIIMALIGTLLTALVVAREWERGSMEALFSTPIHISELILGKVIPYFVLGMLSMFLCVSVSVFLFNVPFVGSIFILSISTALFLLAGLSQGLLISTLAKNQFVASQAAINAAFLPAYMLSGFLYEIESMPLAIKAVTYLLPARYFVSIIQTSFLAGVIWSELWPNMLALSVMAAFFLFIVVKKSKKSLE
ncbi:MAG: ABC transporter permease [Proteobacteria bacterium]|nr:ABC transporter permease [Pseudomonadota bacterium]